MTDGGGWRLGAWIALAIGVIASWLIPPATFSLSGLAGWAVLVAAFVIGPAITAIVCAAQGASRAAAAGDRRFIVVLPLWASFAHLASLMYRLIT